MKTYIYNTNFDYQSELSDQLISKEAKVINNITDDLVIMSEDGPLNYNQLHKITKQHMRVLFHGLLIIDINDNRLVDKHFPKTQALYIGSMFEDHDLLIMADNGCHFTGNSFNNKLQTMPKEAVKDMYTLDNIYMIYIAGNVVDSILVSQYYTYYDEINNWTIVSYGKLEPTNVLNFVKGYKIVVSDDAIHIPLLNIADEAIAIGSKFDVRELNDKVDHVDRFYMINQYIKQFYKE